MELKKVERNGLNVAVARPACGEPAICSAQSALDVAMQAKYEAEAERIAIPKEAVAEEFFVLSTGLAGEVLQKFVNYHVKLAIFGDFSRYTSKPLHDFIYESNNGNDVFFVATEAEAIDRLSRR